MRFAIVAPPYRNSSAGVRVLHRLCHLLNEAGQDAALTTAIRHPAWNTKTLDAIDGETVAVYPETVAGNPLGATRVVRFFVLGRLGAVTGPAAGDGSELVVYLDDWLRDAASAFAGRALGASHRLFLSVLEPDLFVPARGLRLIDGVFIGRRADIAARYPRHAPRWRYRITDRWPATREGLAALLQRTRVLYAYDAGSALPFEASLCGARVFVVDEGGTLVPSTPWESHALVRRWWDDGPLNVRRFVALAHERWPER